MKHSGNRVETILLANKNKCISTSYLRRTMVSQALQPQLNLHDTVLEKSLRKIDQDVRRTGRITRKELEEVIAELHEAKSASSAQSLLIIRCCGNLLPEETPEVRSRLVLKFWQTLEDLGIPLDVSHYNALLRVHLENEHDFSPNDFLSTLHTKGIEPNRVTYLRLMGRYCQQGDMDGATGILQIMRDKQLPVNEGVFNTLLMGHSQAGDMSSALSIVGLMEQASVDPSEETYTALMCGYAKSGDIEAINKLVQECTAKEIFLQDKDYMDVIYTLASNGWAQHVDKIIAHLEKSWGYNQDAFNLILRLVNINQVEVGLKMLKTMPRALLPDGKPASAGVFFIRQLVKTKQPTEKIVAICEELTNNDLNPRALQDAVEHSLHLGSGHSEQSVALMHALKNTNPSMKQHQFWPLLVSHGKDGNIPGLLKVVESMKKVFQVSPSGSTLRDHVIPYLPQEMTSEDIIGTLKSALVSHASAACALLCYRLAQHNIAEAANIAAHNTAHYPPILLRRPLTTSYLHTKDLVSYLTILHKIVEGLSNSTASPEVNPDEVIGTFATELAKLADASSRALTVTTVLQGLVNEALGMNKDAGQRLRERLGNAMTQELSTLIDRLTAGNLTPLTRTSRLSRTSGAQDIANLEKLKSTLEERSESTLAVRKQLLTLYCRNRDLEKTETLKATLDNDNFVCTGGAFALLIDLYTYHELLDKAWSTYTTLVQREPDFTLDHTKVVRLAALLVKHDRITDCMQLLHDQGKEREPLSEPSFSYNNQCWKLLNMLAEHGKVDELKQVFSALLENKYVVVSNTLLGPFVKVHIVRGDLAAALQEFERCCQLYLVTPYKNDLTCKLIMAEDSSALQKLTDLSTGIHGEVNSLYDLVFAFVECGKIRHAKRILETPGLGSRPQRVISACERYCQEGQTVPLERLLDATKDSAHIVDRTVIYYSLLMVFVKANEVDKAIELWTRMQEEDVPANDEFLGHLGKLMKKHGREVPFVVPTSGLPVSRNNTDTGSKPSPVHKLQTDQQTPSTRLKRALKDIHFGTNINGDELTAYNIELKKMATDIISAMLDTKILPKVHELKFALRQLGPAGELVRIEAISSLLPDTMKKMVNYEKWLCIASVIAGKGEEYLSKLERQINEAKNEDLDTLREHYPRGGSTTLLIQYPELKQRFEEMARTYAVRDVLYPINDLWAYLFECGEESQAGELWSEFLARSPKIVIEHILETTRTTGNTNLGQRLVNQLRGSDKLPRIVGSAYSCLIDVYVTKKQYDEALEVLDDAIKEDHFEDVKKLVINRLEKLLQTEGKTLPNYIINLRNRSNASSNSSSSSDEEK